jgi:hypothetical protein
MGDSFTVPDGLEELRRELPFLIAAVVRTARWVHPQTFKSLPLWYPETARGRPMFDVAWSRIYTNQDRETKVVAEKREPNIKAGTAFVAALGTKKSPNWTVCHIWGVDDPKFQKSNRVVRDPRYYSCVGNMVWLPTPLKGFTDSTPEIKRMLRTCAFHLYGWTCEHVDVASDAAEIKAGSMPLNYPAEWPTRDKKCFPPGTAPFSSAVKVAVEKRKTELRTMLNDESLKHFPRNEVREVLKFWRIKL